MLFIADDPLTKSAPTLICTRFVPIAAAAQSRSTSGSPSPCLPPPTNRSPSSFSPTPSTRSTSPVPPPPNPIGRGAPDLKLPYARGPARPCPRPRLFLLCPTPTIPAMDLELASAAGPRRPRNRRPRSPSSPRHLLRGSRLASLCYLLSVRPRDAPVLSSSCSSQSSCSVPDAVPPSPLHHQYHQAAPPCRLLSPFLPFPLVPSLTCSLSSPGSPQEHPWSSPSPPPAPEPPVELHCLRARRSPLFPATLSTRRSRRVLPGALDALLRRRLASMPAPSISSRPARW